MTNGGDESNDEAPDEHVDGDIDEVIAVIESRLDEIADEVESANLEVDLDRVESALNEVADEVETIDLPESDDDEEDEESPLEVIESRIDSFQDDIDAKRGPYADDVQEELDAQANVVESTRWTVDGVPEVFDAVDKALEKIADQIEFTGDWSGETIEELADTLRAAGDEIIETNLHPDDDAQTIKSLLGILETLDSELSAAEEWSDLEVREQLTREGFYDRLTANNRKDFPPELNVIRIAEKENDAERILLALEYFDSDFIEEQCMDALGRLGSPEALDPMLQLAQRRNEEAIRVIGKIGDPAAVDALVGYVDSNNPSLQQASLRALGEIGSDDTTEDVAQGLADDVDSVRSAAARSLGLIGDTRAIEPLVQILETDSSDVVRASAAWALNQIGTEQAREAVSTYINDRAYIVQVEAEKATSA